MYTGVLSIVWYVVWMVVARHNMIEHPCITHDEKLHILHSLSHSSDVTLPINSHSKVMW